ncbi:hypothetical protein AAFF_G00142640 [Aldrovandia affinis]|uniref:Uncharacterized protein n=1 Tax=Aldrovandia affinis TaxID=143900 RepID=A0AAD7T196_9TELE|nr:hypothetical protein AAFF_G00142640 [Aldrovandia affinis]
MTFHFTHVTPLLSSLHWLPIAARIRFKSLVLAFQVARGTAPPYLQTLITSYTPARPLRSTSSGKLTVPSLRAPGNRSSRSRLFSVLTPRGGMTFHNRSGPWNHLRFSARDSKPTFSDSTTTEFCTSIQLSSPLPTCSILLVYVSLLTPHKNKTNLLTFSFPVLQV